MEFKSLTDRLAVAGQIAVTDFPKLAKMGIKSIINNRPDAETTDQPTSHELASLAADMNITFVHIPVKPGLFTDKNIVDFKKAYQELPGPILAFCRTGTRSASLWALSEADKQDPDEILDAARKAGYNLATLRPLLTSLMQGQGQDLKTNPGSAWVKRIAARVWSRFR